MMTSLKNGKPSFPLAKRKDKFSWTSKTKNNVLSYSPMLKVAYGSLP